MRWGRVFRPGRRNHVQPCREPFRCPRPRRATRPCPPTSRRASTSSPARRRTSPSTSWTTSTRSPSTPRRSSRGAPTRRPRRSCASRRRWASRASRSSRRPRGRSTATGIASRRAGCDASAPLFSLDMNPFESAVAADHVNVEDTARRVSRSEVEAAIELIGACERVLIAGHGPDGLLRLLPAAPADAARRARGDRRVAVAGGALAARPDRRRDARDRPLRRAARIRWSCGR